MQSIVELQPCYLQTHCSRQADGAQCATSAFLLQGWPQSQLNLQKDASKGKCDCTRSPRPCRSGQNLSTSQAHGLSSQGNRCRLWANQGCRCTPMAHWRSPSQIARGVFMSAQYWRRGGPWCTCLSKRWEPLLVLSLGAGHAEAAACWSCPRWMLYGWLACCLEYSAAQPQS